MFSNETIRKLREIHMGVMAEQLSAQLEDPQFRNVPFEDRLAMLVDAEWSARKSNRLTGLIKKAGYAAWRISSILPNGIWTGEQILRFWHPVRTFRGTKCDHPGRYRCWKDIPGLFPGCGGQPELLRRSVSPAAESSGRSL